MLEALPKDQVRRLSFALNLLRKAMDVSREVTSWDSHIRALKA
ncbi:hypothetical protein RRSWK_02987 [Rhodopirellula sp. SWK7]|nr:hypothetical protein RRSWK_02987 [Rhodopirellula sp. SWK7]